MNLNTFAQWAGIACVLAFPLIFASCAGERQGLVCEEIEYRLNTFTYSPDQRAYMEEELRTCRVEEAEKKRGSAEARRSIYERYAASDSSKAKDTADVSVSTMLKDSSGVATTSIYERYGAANGDSSATAANPATAVLEAASSDSAAASGDASKASSDSAAASNSAPEASPKVAP